MRYLHYIYAYLFFVGGILLVSLITYLTIGEDFFSVQVEITRNWLIAGAVFSIGLIPTYLLGVACLLLGERFLNVEVTGSAKVWAFLSGTILAAIPVFGFLMPGSVFSLVNDPYIMTWVPIVLTAIAYITIKKYS